MSASGPRSESAILLRIAAPLMASQAGQVLMGVVDTFIVGRVSAEDLGAVGLGNNVVMVIAGFGLGLIMGLESFVSQARGRGDESAALAWLRQSVWLSLIVGLPLSLAALLPLALFTWGDVDPEVAALASAYVWARLPGHVFTLLFTSYRSFLAASGKTRPILWAVAIANVANLFLDVVLVWGFGLGAVGVGLATSTCWLVMLAVAVPAVRVSYGAAFRFGDPSNRPDPPALRSLARIGAPIGSQFALEVGIFAMVSVLVGREGPEALAGHQIALTMAALTFMMAMGLSIAATARVGYHVGRKNLREARRSAFLALGWSVALMSAGGLVFALFGEPIARLFAPDEPVVVQMGARLLLIAAVFSVSDGAQAVSGGILRGLGDTSYSFWANMVGHWVIGLPVAMALGLSAGLGAEGYWWGLVAGLSAVAVALVLRFVIRLAGPIESLEVGATTVRKPGSAPLDR